MKRPVKCFRMKLNYELKTKGDYEFYQKELGHILHRAYLILIGVLPQLGIGTPALHLILGIVAIAAGVLILLDEW